MSDELPEPLGADQIGAFSESLDALINRFVDEYDLPVAAIVGVLNMTATCMTLEAIEDDEEGDDY